jgi:hypothetical protein
MIGDAGTRGRIPFAFRIGVTGHRTLDDPESLSLAVREALSRLKELIPGSPTTNLVLVVVSALAEGADRLVAKQILAEKGSRLEAALPLRREDYLNDFRQDGSKREFQGLLEQASETWQASPGSSREGAYELAGRYVVDRSDALIALWDGEPARGQGGTAAIVEYARKRGVPLVWIGTKGDRRIIYELEAPRASIVRDAARKLHDYNASVIDASYFSSQAHAAREQLMPDTASTSTDTFRLSYEKATDWLIPYFVRADIITLRYQRRFQLLSWLIFALAAAAVAVVAIQTNFWPGQDLLAAIEVIFLLLLLSILRMNQRWRLHDRWISYRFLAERLRSGYFLALAGRGDRREWPTRLSYLSDSSEVWIERALAEVMARRPELSDSRSDVTLLRDYLNHYWIGSQIRYHNKTACRQRRWDDRMNRATVLLFVLTLIAAFLHMLGHDVLHILSFWQELLIVVSITVPTIGAAIHGIRTQHQFRHHSERSCRMAGLLAQVHEEMGQAADLKTIQKVAAETEQLMREESSDWFGVMRFRDMELIT